MAIKKLIRGESSMRLVRLTFLFFLSCLVLFLYTNNALRPGDVVSSAICQAATPSALESPKKPRVVVIANTTAEADGLMAVLASKDMRPSSLQDAPPLANCLSAQGSRGSYAKNGVRVEFWCLWDLAGGDGTLNKVKKLSNAIQPPGEVAPAMVVAFGTAAGHWETSYNGSVVVGSAVLLHSPSFLKDEEVTEVTNALRTRGVELDKIIESEKGWGFLSNISAWNATGSLFNDKRIEMEDKFLKPPIHPAAIPVVLLSPNRLGLSSINVKSGSEYARADAETLKVALRAMSKSTKTFEVGGVETTHGLIRAFSPKEAPFIYVTAISNRLGYFPMEMSTRRAAQHVAVINNAGVVTAYLVDWILSNPALLAPVQHRTQERED